MSFVVGPNDKDHAVCWLVEINTPNPAGVVLSPMPEMPGFGSMMEVEVPTVTSGDAPVLRLSDRGWIGEPDDSAMPNVRYAARLATPPVLAREIPIYPDETRRAVYNEATIELLNQDGSLSLIEGDWRMAGVRVVILRGPHRRPLNASYAEFTRIAELRVSAPAVGSGRMEMPLSSAAADLSVPACRTYGGTGGQDGGSSLAGTNIPRVFGFVRNVEPVLIDTAKLIYQFHDGAMSAVVSLRDRGIVLTPAGDVATFAALSSATMAANTYRTCLATGHVRLGSTPTDVTGDVRGDVSQGGYGGGYPAHLAVQILRTAAGVPSARSPEGSFSSWIGSEAGLVVRDGTAADAMERLATGIYGWWGADEFGNFQGGIVEAPENRVPTVSLGQRDLSARPAELKLDRAPWWRARVEYQRVDKVQDPNTLAGAVLADRDYWGKQARTAEMSDTSIRQKYPLSVDVEAVPGVLDSSDAAQLVAARALSVCGVERRAWTVTLSSSALLPSLPLGACVRLTWPSVAALSAGRNLLVRSVDGSGERPELVLWG